MIVQVVSMGMDTPVLRIGGSVRVVSMDREGWIDRLHPMVGVVTAQRSGNSFCDEFSIGDAVRP